MKISNFDLSNMPTINSVNSQPNIDKITNISNNVDSNKFALNLKKNINEVEEYDFDLVRKADDVNEVYDEKNNVKVNQVYDSSGNSIIGEEIYYYDDNGNITKKKINNFFTEKIIETEYENGEVARISNYDIDIATGVKTLKNTIDVSAIDDLITKQGNLTYEDIQSMTCFDNSNCTKLTTQITDVLSTEQIETINAKIQEAVEYAGPGTGAGVAAAAITLITELQNQGIYLPYYYSGGHASISTGLSQSWGSKTNWTGNSTKRNIESLDCSGFAMWALKNGGVDISGGLNAKIFTNLSNTSKIKFNELTAGDVLANPGHVVLVLDTYLNENGETIAVCAESTSDVKNGTIDGGVVITTFTEAQASKYSKVDMDNYYINKIQKKSNS